MTVIKIPEKVLEDIRWNAQHGKCRQCREIFDKIEDGRIDTSKLDRDLLSHLESMIESRKEKSKNLCLDCFYYGITRFGAVCNYYGFTNPVKTECPAFKSQEEGEKELLENLETAETIRTMMAKLSELKPKIKNVADAKLKEELLELCLMADILKKRLER